MSERGTATGETRETPPAPAVDVVIVGAGLGGLSAAITAADYGLTVALLEAGPKVGGAAAYSGGQVWVGGNHVQAARGIEDNLERTLEYVHAAAARDETSIDSALSQEWLSAAAEAADYFERTGVITWDIVPDYPDYYYPDLPGSARTGRYLTSTRYDGKRLGPHIDELHISPHFPVGITYAEMFSWGGMSSKTHWDWDLMRERRAELQLTFGTGIVAPFFEAVLARSIDLRLGHRVTSLVREGSGFTVVADGPDGPVSMSAGSAILATGAHDWSGALMRTHTGIVPEHGGSLAPTSLMGDVFSLTSPLGGEAAALPPWAAPVLPGYRLPMPAFEGDAGFRACYEHCLPHTVIVNSDGERFTDDSFHSKIVAHVLGDEGEARFPIFMVWDSQHHQKYGLGTTMPGGQYPDGLVARGSSLQELAESLGVDAANLVQTVDRYNAGARLGRDDEFGRGSNMSVRLFRGDRNQEPNACIGPIEEGPYYGMQLRLLSTGIAAAGVVTGPSGQVLDADREPIDGLYAVGECAARAAAGVGYNSGYSLSRAMAFGHLAAKRIAATT